MRWWLQPLLFTGIVGMGIVAVRSGWMGMLVDQQAFRHQLLENGLLSALMISAAGVIFTGFGGPRQLLALVSGFALGPLWGSIYATALTLLGAVGCFYTARFFLRPSLKWRLSGRMKDFDALTHHNPLLKILIIRLLPVGSNLLTNVFAGSSRMAATPFLVGSGLGYLPQMIVFALVGAGVGQASQSQLTLAIVMFAVAAALSLLLYRNHRNRFLASTVTTHNSKS